MVDTYQADSFESRKSQNITFADYTKDKLFWGSLPFLAGGATLGFALLTKNKVKPLDGSPSITYWAYEKLFTTARAKALKTEVGQISEVSRMPFVRALTDDKDRQIAYVRGIWNFIKGFEVGVIPAAYHLWRQDEKNRLDLVPVRDRLEALNGIKPTDAELREENASLRQQLAYVEGAPTLDGERQYEGKLNARQVQVG